LIVGAYLLGCLTVGYYLVWLWRADDVRRTGSGSTGATNVSRVLGRPGFVLTFIWDFGKGALALWLARRSATHPETVMLALLAVVAGHIWPVQLAFRGGKGVSTALGGLLVYEYPALVVLVALTGVFLLVTRNYKPAGLAAFALTPLVLFLSHRFELVTVFGVSALGMLILIAHRRNIREALGQYLADGRTRRAKRSAAKD